MSGDTAITLVGNLTADPELRFTQSGVPVADFNTGTTDRTVHAHPLTGLATPTDGRR